MPDRRQLGRRAEALVAGRLEDEGFEIVERNARVGRLEIDLVARRGRLLVFCEVRARQHDRWMTPAESIDGRKQERIRRAAAGWLRKMRPGAVDVRFDAASVTFDVPGGRLLYYENAF